jgi:hypothetical protein
MTLALVNTVIEVIDLGAFTDDFFVWIQAVPSSSRPPDQSYMPLGQHLQTPLVRCLP